MNDDIRILRDALKRYREFVEVPNGDPMEVPLYWYNSAKATYAEACSPERIRRLLDDAERYQLLRQGRYWSVIDWCGESMTDRLLDFSIDQKRKA